MKFDDSIFKAYDIRGVVRLELNSEIARAVGRALADLLETPGAVAVGYDMRPASVEYATALREGLVLQGRDVVDIGLVTSDMIYFAVGSLDLAGGAMVTASHNPGQYDGIKLCRRGAAPIGEDTGLEVIEQALREDHYREDAKPGKITKRDITEAWVEHALGFVEAASWPKFKIAVDAGNGMAGAIVPHLEAKIPPKVTEMFFELDGTFPNHVANPLVIENLKAIVATIRDNDLDLGIAFDGDGDRAFLVDEQGERMSGSVLAAVIAESILVRYPGSTILYNAICSRIVPETIIAGGGKPVRTRVGHSFIKAKMREYDAPFAGEHSGHFYFRDNYYADSGLIAALVGVDVLAKSGLKLSELAAKYRKYHNSDEINLEVNDKDVMLASVKAAYTDGQCDDLDGLTVNYPTWWFNVRPSNTEPVLRLNVEASSEAELTIKTQELLKLLEVNK